MKPIYNGSINQVFNLRLVALILMVNKPILGEFTSQFPPLVLLKVVVV